MLMIPDMEILNENLRSNSFQIKNHFPNNLLIQRSNPEGFFPNPFRVIFHLERISQTIESGIVEKYTLYKCVVFGKLSSYCVCFCRNMGGIGSDFNYKRVLERRGSSV